MVKNKTLETEISVDDYLTTIADEKKRKDCSTIIEILTEQTGFEPLMWGTSIVGFGVYNYKYETGREGSAPLFGLATRANNIALYLSAHFDNRENLLSKFGKYKSDKGCVNIQKLEDIDTNILIQMVKNSIEHKKLLYPN